MSLEVPALRIVPSIELRIRELRRCEIGCPMAKTLDQQLNDLRVIALKIKDKYGINLSNIPSNTPRIKITDEVDSAKDGIELLSDLLDKFFRLSEYIDSLR